MVDPQEYFEDTKGVIRICKSKDKQDDGQKKKDKRTNNDLQNITHKTKDRVTRTPLKIGGDPMCSGRVGTNNALADKVIQKKIFKR